MKMEISRTPGLPKIVRLDNQHRSSTWSASSKACD